MKAFSFIEWLRMREGRDQYGTSLFRVQCANCYAAGFGEAYIFYRLQILQPYQII